MLQLDIRTNLTAFLASVDRRRLDQLPQALAWTLNDLALEAKAALIAEMSRVFDRPTPFTLNSIYTWMASKRRLVATVELKDFAGKGTPAARYLQAEIEGGPRRLKRFERALQAAGLLPRGLFAVPGPGATLDQYGNLPGPYLVKILSQLRAFPEAGYRANRRQGQRTQYFVPSPTMGLKPGIYQRLGARGVSPVILFVRAPSYSKRFDFYGVIRRVSAEAFPRRFPANWARALASDRGARA